MAIIVELNNMKLMSEDTIIPIPINQILEEVTGELKIEEKKIPVVSGDVNIINEKAIIDELEHEDIIYEDPILSEHRKDVFEAIRQIARLKAERKIVSDLFMPLCVLCFGFLLCYFVFYIIYHFVDY